MSKITYEVMRNVMGHGNTIINIGDIKLYVVLRDDTLIVESVSLVNYVSPSKIEACFARFRGWISVDENRNELINAMPDNSSDNTRRVEETSAYSAWERMTRTTETGNG